MGLQLGLQSGVTFSKKWGYKSGVKGVRKAERGNYTFLPFNCEDSTPLTATVFEGYTLLYIVYRGISAAFVTLLGEGDTPEGY